MTSENRLPLRALWGTIQAAVRERVMTAELWERANAAAQARGFTGVSGSALEMGSLRSIAARVRNAAETFTRADPMTTITPEHFAPDINAYSPVNQALTPHYRVRFEQTVRTSTGVEVSTMRTSSFMVQLPGTKALLLAEIEADAALLAEKYGEEHLGVGAIEITVV